MQANEGFVLGEYDTRAAEHGNGVIRDMLGRDAKDGEAHSVTVAIWVDGRLQFAGSDCRPHNGREVTKWEARQVATVIAQRMDARGGVEKEAHFPQKQVPSCADICAGLRDVARVNQYKIGEEPQCYGKPVSVYFSYIADQFEASHRRELEQALRSAKRRGDGNKPRFGRRA
jgi:hypothetical protein